ncbi:protein zinc induced facilitator-LIKE 1 [Podospora aff. communis PSN243]|uniref:Protein zinc induced facilitator-LIKE 1 n=1 Tax=Podospora aff. communis PSN243 TaxID=3040156 RepID=A0AAV9GGF6_9PEZI|nr:protein zinc induced facilitator-LIKE 1 [Podospora aff. communis PSN243]
MGGGDENTPLLAGEAVAHPVSTISEDTTVNENSSSDGDVDENKPMPVFQILVLCYARAVEPMAFFSIFPYVNKMAKENGNLNDADVGFNSGLIESLFSLTQMIVMIWWGRAADRFGRRPVLIFSLCGVTIATGFFGTAKTIWQMILFRCLAGVFAGTIVTIRTMLSELSSSKTQARVFSWFAFSGNMGILFGPLLGGALADPAEQYPRIFGGVPFFVSYPYALPSLAVSAIGLSAVVATALFTEETLKREPSSECDEEGASLAKPPPLTTWEIIKSPSVPLILYTYAHVMMLAYAYTAIAPLFWFTPIELGGLGFSPLKISLFMALGGFAQAIWVLVVFPPLQNRIGTNGVLRWCGNCYPIFFSLCPAFNLLLREGLTTIFWTVAPALLMVGCGVSMSFTAIQLALNDVSPTPMVLGTLNAIALSLVTGVRAVSPAAYASLFAIGARTQWLWGYAIWVLLASVAAGFTAVSRYLPDYAELKRDRDKKRMERILENSRER